MRVANLAGRLAVVTSEGAIDVEAASGGRLPSDPQQAYAHWDQLRSWADCLDGEPQPFEESRLGAPVPRPQQVFAIGLNYADHAAEAGLEVPRHPQTFTKFPSSIAPPNATVTLSGDKVDWELELVAVVGRYARAVREADAWDYIAGLTIGQDLSDRAVQMRPPVPQFSLGKSFPGFGPIGPVVVTPDELPDREDVVLSCRLGDEEVQRGQTSNLIFRLPALISQLSAIVPLLPGDLIFTGTPAGIGATRSPQRFLREGDVLRSSIAGIGSFTTRFRHAERPEKPVDRAPALHRTPHEQPA